jgi:hypothetical protein
MRLLTFLRVFPALAGSWQQLQSLHQSKETGRLATVQPGVTPGGVRELSLDVFLIPQGVQPLHSIPICGSPLAPLCIKPKLWSSDYDNTILPPPLSSG